MSLNGCIGSVTAGHMLTVTVRYQPTGDIAQVKVRIAAGTVIGQSGLVVC